MAEITDVRVFNFESDGKLKAFASVTLDDSYVVHGLRVLEGENGLWVSMPATKNKKGEFKDTFHPISREAREILIDAVLEAYNNSE